MTERRHSAGLEKEFELERVSLFSDAVFAIAITLLVIDIKWPELPETLAGIKWDRALGPTIFSFVGLILSFISIGHFWTQHLRLFKLVVRYDQGLIARNLLCLFFIVTFPFTASGLLGHIREGFLLPLYAYLGNVVLVSAAYLNLCWYAFRPTRFLTVEGKKEEKKYIFIQSRNATFAMLSTVLVVGATNLIIPKQWEIACYSTFSSGIFLVIANKKAAKYEPVKLS